MTRYIDLHTHSTCSDGTLTPTALLDLAARRHLAAIALTDHDTVAGVVEAICRGRTNGVQVISGIEVSSRLDETSLHILGYGISHEQPEFLSFLAELQQARQDRNRSIVGRFHELGIPLRMAELEAVAGDQIGRPHFARLLVAKGICRDSQEAFVRYLRRGSPAFVEHVRPPADEVIAHISKAGGVAILAHPASTDPGLEKILTIVARLKEYGLAGLEAFYPTHSGKVCRALQKIAADHGMLVSGGTDFHGDNPSGIPLGGNAKSIRVPLKIWEEIRKRLPSAP
jgi:hypothetical protein